jgi:hypothetical protein
LRKLDLGSVYAKQREADQRDVQNLMLHRVRLISTEDFNTTPIQHHDRAWIILLFSLRLPRLRYPEHRLTSDTAHS